MNYDTISPITGLLNYIQGRLFRAIISNRLVYNSCWEDPRIDRRLLQLNTDSKIVMLTSAGCNAFDYLLDRPARIHCVDSNPAQNALLDLKLSLFKNNDYPLLWEFFGRGRLAQPALPYHKRLRKHLSKPSAKYWDRHLNYFSYTPTLPGFYYRGTAGKVALAVRSHFRCTGLQKKIAQLFNAQTLPIQKEIYSAIEPRLLTHFQKWLLGRPAVLSLLGVPAAQRNIINREFPEGLRGFLRQSLRRVFTRIPVADNYFWLVYFKGAYTKSCCPNYLKETHFSALIAQINKISFHNTSLLEFLQRNPGSYSHFVLLDHQDWLSNSKPEILKREWRQLLANAQTGARILFRSAGKHLDFLPGFVNDRVTFHPELTDPLHSEDRVGTYGSTHLAIVQ